MPLPVTVHSYAVVRDTVHKNEGDAVWLCWTHEGGVQELYEALQSALGARAEHAVDEIHHRVLVGERDEGQPGEDEHEKHQLGHFEGPAQRTVEGVAGHHVHHGEEHHGEEDDRGDSDEKEVGAANP